jgi:hypothetical protein
VLTNDGSGGFVTSQTITNEIGILPMDVNGDGWTDLVTFTASNFVSIPEVWLNSPAGITFHIPINAESSLTVNGVTTLNNAGNSFSGNGAGLTSLSAGNIASGTLNDARLSANVALLNRANQVFTGSNSFGNTGINPPATLSFGSATRQMLNLWSTRYAIGVQTSTLYQRSDAGFAWFRQGTHSDAQNDPGAGGTTLMNLATTGQLTVFGTSANGIEGHSSNSIASGLYGQNDAGGFGVAGRTTGSGSAVFGDNLNASGWAGDFNGKVRCVSLTQTSDRNVKQDFVPVNARQVLDKVAVLPISQWKFKTDPATPHLGPMAQDFYAAFGLGEDERHITTVDEGGVALAAIQGLNQKLQDELNRQDAENTRLKRQNDSLTERLNELEVVVRSITEKK